jgi:hypothetical protein
MRAFVPLLFLLLPFGLRAQCFGTEQFPLSTVVPDATGASTTISTQSWAGDYVLVSLTAGGVYRFSSSVATDHITVSTALASGAVAFGTQPVLFTASATQTYFVHFHTNAACATEQVFRTTQVQRVYCPASATNCGGVNGSIASVSIGSLNTTSSGCGVQGYSDLSAGPTTSLLVAQALPITVTNGGSPSAGIQVRAFVDWNRDFTLGDAGEVFILSTTDNITFTGSITPPPGTAEGAVRMRVRIAFTGALPACGTTPVGEAEDYTLFVVDPGTSIFSGGNGRGDAASLITPTPVVSNIFSGGNGRGDVASLITPAPVASNIFTGGNGRGDVASLITPTPIASNIFTGGNGRGDVASLITPTPIASNIFTGGNGRGDVASLITPTPIASNIFAGGNGRGDVASLINTEQPTFLLLALRGMLEGPYSSATGQMSDALRTAGIVPTSEPYTALGYAQVGGGGAETITPAVLATTGNNAIVDWVVVELRNAVAPGTVLATRSALIQRDGDIVATDGVSPLTFNNAPGTYHVALRHRNHLGVMTGNATALGLSTTPVDLSLASTATFGTDARKSVTGAFPAQVLWVGDVNFDDEIKYVGQDNDRDPILQAIGGVVPTNTTTGYLPADVNMDGTVKYSGENNDRDPILQTIGGVVPTNTRVGQLP